MPPALIARSAGNDNKHTMNIRRSYNTSGRWAIDHNGRTIYFGTKTQAQHYINAASTPDNILGREVSTPNGWKGTVIDYMPPSTRYGGKDAYLNDQAAYLVDLGTPNPWWVVASDATFNP